MLFRRNTRLYCALFNGRFPDERVVVPAAPADRLVRTPMIQRDILPEALAMMDDGRAFMACGEA
jgi:hypothetical protein